jgi:hypothetical protein
VVFPNRKGEFPGDFATILIVEAEATIGTLANITGIINIIPVRTSLLVNRSAGRLERLDLMKLVKLPLLTPQAQRPTVSASVMSRA